MKIRDEQFQAGKELCDAIIGALKTERGVHAETAVSAAARITGTLVLRSCGLPLAKLQPAGPIFSDVSDQRGQRALGVVDTFLEAGKIPVDKRRPNVPVEEAHRPHMSLLETQSQLEPACQAILGKCGLTGEDGAQAAAIAVALMIQKTAQSLDPNISYAIAVNGLVEGCKTVPIPATEARKGWLGWLRR
jgi:hypothetical protein